MPRLVVLLYLLVLSSQLELESAMHHKEHVCDGMVLLVQDLAPLDLYNLAQVKYHLICVVT
jgi:hypothetical protein